MTKRTPVWLVLAAAALATQTSVAREDKLDERARYLFQDLIELAETKDADLALKVRLAMLYRQTGANEKAAELMNEIGQADPDMLAMFNPKALPELEEFLARSQGGADAGPDVIVGDLNGLGNYTSGGPVGGKLAFSIGTTSCNMGTAVLNWIELSNLHPVIAQNFYRIHSGRIEQIGMGWLKHGFCALQEGICGACQPVGGCCCQQLGILCSDPYTASLNGSQGRLGPRSEVNPSTGVYPWPFYQRNVTGNAVFKRVQVSPQDMNTTTYAGAIWISEGHYVTKDDADFGNQANNASYRRFQPTWNGTTVTSVGFTGSTQRTKTAIQAWQDFVAGVTLVNVDVPSDGRLILGYKVTDNGNGTWDYEYAIQNLYSHRAANMFSVPVPAGVSVTNIGFHDVDYHSGDGTPNGTTQEGTDWLAVADGGAVTWSTGAEATNPNANALKWGTLYNFRFTANSGPVNVNADIGLFRTGTPGSVSVPVQGPDGPTCLLEGDINGDNIVNFEDLNIVLSGWGAPYNFTNLNFVLSQWQQSCP